MPNQTVITAIPLSISSFSAATTAAPFYNEDAPIEEVQVIPDFLPPPEELVFYRERAGE